MSKVTSEQPGWDYGHNLPPQLWHLHPEFAGGGLKRQSPIPITDCEAIENKNLAEIAPAYQPVDLSEFLFVDLHLEVKVPEETGEAPEKKSAGGVEFGNQLHPLKQFHFHTPSEHTLDGKYYDMELHLVHGVPEDLKAEYESLVVGVFFAAVEGASENSLLAELISQLSSVRTKRPVEARPSKRRPAPEVDPAEGYPDDHSYYTYHGSLTTIPCTEYVRWCVLKTPLRVPPHQITAFADYVPGGNNRPLQPPNDRLIEKFNQQSSAGKPGAKSGGRKKPTSTTPTDS
jgi:carbonic anhydrase